LSLCIIIKNKKPNYKVKIERDLECLSEAFARTEGFDDALKLSVTERVTFLDPVFENGGNAD
jgi:RIO-like serine/threonine protein kinase